MAKVILFLLSILPTLLSGQGTIEISQAREVYHVLKSNQIVRQGGYKRLDDFSDIIRIEGFYKNNAKDSIWTIYNDNGELEQKFDFTNNRLVYYKLNNNQLKQKYKVIRDSITSFETMLERPPLYIGGDLWFFDNIFENLKYPDSASIRGVSGDVLISFIIDKNGKTCSHRIKKGIGYGCNEEALRVVRNIPETWLAGILNGQAVDVEMTLAINFTVQSIPLSGH